MMEGMGSQETFYEYIKKLIDQWNLKISVSQKELKSLFTTISEKAVIWEFYSSLLIIIFWLTVSIIGFRYIRKLNKERNFKESFKLMTKSIDEANQKFVKTDIFRIIIFITYFAALVMIVIPLLVTNFIDLIECIYFPEKVVMNFFGQYMK